MMRILHRAEHWQLFIFAVGIPLIVQIFMMVGMFSSMGNERMVEPELVFGPIMVYFPIIMLFGAGTLYLWMWAVGVGLQSDVPKDVHLKVGLFKGFLVFQIVYVALFVGFFISMFSGLLERMTMDPSSQEVPSFVYALPAILPLHLFAMFCQFYNMYFVSKTIVTVEKQEEISFSDHVGEFFLIWFWFIGVWILQPRINRIAGERKAGGSLDSIFISKR